MLPDLNEINFLRGNPVYLFMDIEKENFKNIGYFDLKQATFDQILLIIQRFAKLRYIRIMKLKGGFYCKNDIIDLKTLNEERKKLIGACKTEILVKQKIYIATKHAMMKTNFSLIELKPLEATLQPTTKINCV